jgi:hypothetical protein
MGIFEDWIERIPAPGDRVLLEEAHRSFKADARRAAYVFLWIACAESIKRRFRELGARDNVAGAIVGKFEDMESKQRAIDSYLLDQAKDYGLITDVGHTRLKQVYQLRCVFGHPYEEAPSAIQVEEAMDAVSACLLALPVRLRHAYLKTCLRLLVEDETFLDDTKGAVEKYSTEVVSRADLSLSKWFLRALWESIEGQSDDPSLAWMRRRGIWFSWAYLNSIGEEGRREWDFREDLTSWPRTVTKVLTDPTLFQAAAEQVQDIVVGNHLQTAEQSRVGVNNLEHLRRAGVLSVRHIQRFDEAVGRLPFEVLGGSIIGLERFAERLIRALKIYTWDVQNGAVDALAKRPPSDVAVLSAEVQVELGRNVLQAADGKARSAARFLAQISAATADTWPPDFVEGIVLECFANEHGRVRFKVREMDAALKCLATLDPADVARIVEKLKAGIDAGAAGFDDLLSSSPADAVTIVSRAMDTVPALGVLRGVVDTIQSLGDSAS